MSTESNPSHNFNRLPISREDIPRILGYSGITEIALSHIPRQDRIRCSDDEITVRPDRFAVPGAPDCPPTHQTGVTVRYLRKPGDFEPDERVALFVPVANEYDGERFPAPGFSYVQEALMIGLAEQYEQYLLDEVTPDDFR